jgi:T4 RnlA family RNA ligase
MTTYTDKTYRQLSSLCEKNEAFFFKDFQLEDRKYRLFNYRLASWTDFQEPSALDCRGIMFDITNENKVAIASHPMQKFFNYAEGTIDHTKSKMVTMMEKLDGSLISTYAHNGTLRLKSKASLDSSQAVAAMKFLDRNPEYKKDIFHITAAHRSTVNFEYTSPTNRVVVPYQEEKLTILSIRSNKTGDIMCADELKTFLKNNYPSLVDKVVYFTPVSEKYNTEDQEQIIKTIYDEQEGEGYVISMVRDDSSVYFIKAKNDRYNTLHLAKNGAETPKRLFEAVIEETADDLRSLFVDDTYILSLISRMEETVIPIYNHMVKSVEDFYEENKELDRKAFAIKVKKELPVYMGLVMCLYSGKPVDYKDFSKKNMKELFGVSSDVSVKMGDEE